MPSRFKLLLLSIFASIALPASTPAQCVEPPAGVLAWYPGQSNALDVADGNNGLVQYTVGYTNGMVGEAFDFNGGFGYVQLPQNLFPLANGQPFSIELWFSTVAGGVILGQQTGAPYTSLGGWVPMLYVGADGILRAQLFWDGQFQQVSTSAPVNDGNFHHVAVTYDGANETVYLDGTEVGSEALAYSTYAAGFDCQIGTGYTQYWPGGDGGWYAFNGVVDELTLYNSALTLAQVQSIYDAGSAGKCLDQFEPTIVTQPTNQSVLAGTAASFSVTATSLARMTYQWYEDNSPLSGATNSALTIQPVTSQSAGSYYVLVSTALSNVSSAVATLTVTNPPCVPPPPGLVGWWPGQGNATDIVGGNNGVLENGVTFTNGMVGESFLFNGSSSYVQLLKNLFPMPNAGPFSIELWFETTGGGVLIGQQAADPFSTPNNGSVPYLYVGTDGHLYEQLFWNGTFSQISSGAVVNNGIFHHAAITYDGTNQALYLDGAPQGAAPLAYSSYTSNFSCQIGTGFTEYWPAGNGGWYTFNGIIDEVSLYSSALTAGQIESIFAAQGSGKCQEIEAQIIDQPTNLTVAVDGTAVFSVNASSLSPVTYQWFNGAAPIPGATSNTLSLPDVQLSDSGSQFGCVISNTAGVTNSALAVLTVSNVPLTERTVASLGASNGFNPVAGLVQGRNGNFYGVAEYGGTNGFGTVFEVTTNGTLTTLVSFAETNGAEPVGGLGQASDGSFYGTTESGGTNGGGEYYGTIFRVTTNGHLTSLVSFDDTDGSRPEASLFLANDGNLYGTTDQGGAEFYGQSYGTIFRVSTAGVFSNLLSFDLGDGAFPEGGIVQGSDGNFYGVTTSGGNGTYNNPEFGYGVFFKMTTNGAITLLASFNDTNGSDPMGTLVEGRDGSFYGTTSAGGNIGFLGATYGTVFRVTTNGAITPFLIFNGTNGSTPMAGLIQATDGNFYGTTSAGGAYNLGTVFRVTTNGGFSTLFSFDGTNGTSPECALAEGTDGNLYGTTTRGGAGYNGNAQSGNGTVFCLQLPPPPNPAAGLTTNYTLTAAYTGSLAGPLAGNANNSGLSIGHTFTLTGTNLEVFALGVYNNGGGGLVASHPVSLFTNNNGVFTQLPGASLTVPAGASAPLIGSFRYEYLPNPVTLTPGNYGIVVFQMDGFNNSSDPYSYDDGTNNLFVGFPGFTNEDTIYEFNYNPTTNFPSPGGSVGYYDGNWASASFLYTPGASAIEPVQPPVIAQPYLYVNAGDTGNLTASADGSLPLSFQWYYGPSQTPIPGATNSTLTLSNIQTIHTMGNEGLYSVSVANILSGPVFCAATNEESVVVIPDAPPINIMPLGDSITAGVDSSGGGYRAPLYTLLANANFNVNFIGTQDSYPLAWLPQTNHEGHPGFRTDDLSFNFPFWWNDLPVKPDVVLLLAGINDFEQDYYINQATNRLDTLIDTVLSDAPNATVFVSNLTPNTNSIVESEVDTLYNPFIPGIVASHFAQGQHVYFVDLHSAVSVTNLGPDGIHPNDAGYAQMAPVWFHALTSVFPPPGGTNPAVSVTASSATLTYGMVPGNQYITLRSTNLASGGWVPISTNVIPASGTLQVIDNFTDLGGTPPSAAFYQLLQQ